MTTIEFSNQLINLKPSLERFAFNFTLIKADANDLVQDTFLKALMNQDKFVNNDNFKAWTFTIMKNTFFNNYRRGLRQIRKLDIPDNSVLIDQKRTITADDPDSRYSVLEMIENIEKLNDKFRTPLKMHIYGYKYKEIATKLKLNIGTVKSRIYFSREKLKAQLNS